MRQALHILKKDTRYLAWGIGLFAAVAALFGWAGSHMAYAGWPEILLTACGFYLVAKLIHAEALPGDRQFWITRPYRPTSLFAAKLVFILLYVQLPLMVAQAYIAVHAGFSLWTVLPCLLWSQVLIIAAVALPAAALAALTTGMATFLFAALVLATIILATGNFVFRILLGPVLSASGAWPEGVAWFREALVIAVLAAGALAVLHIQYRHRRTAWGRALAIAAAVLVAEAYTYVPRSWALAFQTRMSNDPGASVRVAVEPGVEPNAVGPMWIPAQLSFNTTVEGTDGSTLRADGVDVTFTASDGRRWRPESATLVPWRMGQGCFRVTVVIPKAVFYRELMRPQTLHGSIFFTTFGNLRSKTMPVTTKPADAIDGLRCYTGMFLDRYNNFYCYSAFRWPSRLVYASAGTQTSAVKHDVSYSPLPAELGFYPIETHWASLSPSSGEVTVMVSEPLAHFRRDFEIRDLHLATSRIH